MIVVLDTNVLVAGLRSREGASFRILQGMVDGRLCFALSVPLLLEYEAVLKREIHRHAGVLDERDIDVILDMLCARGRPVRLDYLWRPQLRDEQDEMVLELAVNAGADAIVTFNGRDFSPAAERFGLVTMTPAEFFRKYLKEDER